ncbi:MAG: isoleucine--tRNA ligase [Candidatus Pacebacteria bacterium]|jgi:isoleucyl-tRNA synthetase|nr:isoleucine--tRNA ligase [Candidatus Paceibacterota bacterium]MBT3512065.1 isoleucine--tRNA ligase [Candidatus Paceibacterota bacterium]MBT4004820.1 isoleucine--tRNA ligase [Candidatus Paceibacterota bacterium]MBT4358473.1 isoleucine--tRNA ligase [Candidatus Paceibacterota bacterium]MBT4681257.1 isoleucine--tRNA ligase [Candidatus Paceibacterota bacterium]
MPKIKDLNQQPDLPKLEEETLAWWQDTKAFEKSVEMRPADKAYVFYDGPPFATGMPHYGHIVASTMKDIIPRYWTMKGYRVERKWGWDCHGLPIENIAEKELGIKRKNEIEELGVDKFNEICRSKVLSYVDDWRKIINRLGRWADMENDYKTMDLEFMESVWWVFKQLYDKGLIYEDYRSMHICPRCETTLSQSEVAEGYKDIKDISVTAKFEIKDFTKLHNGSGKFFILAWTTTPWTLPGNFLLAVGPDIEYVLVSEKESDNLYLVAKSRVEAVFSESKFKIIKEFTGSQLKNLNYAPLFPYFKDTENAFRVVTADFVDTEEGTGVVHIAPGFGDDDFKLGQKEKVELIQHVNMSGRFTTEVTDFAGEEVKPKEDHQKTDIEMIRYLAKKDLLFSKKKLTHSYPHCWRCDTPLLNYATGSWFVSVKKIKERMLELAKDINWSPEHIKEGRWGKWLEGARDWSISRQRYWASVIPIWKCECGQMKVYGSIEELEKDSQQKITDLHKHVVDKVTVTCDCGQQMNRIPDVLDTWFDSGSMPYGQAHYPFENKEKFEKNFPAEFIGEGLDQTRAWFYYLHVIAVGVKDTNAFKNVIVNGIVLAEDGKKMSKRLQNYPDPTLLINSYGSDSLRMYLASSPVLKAGNLSFSEKEVSDIRRKVFVIWWNVFKFFKTFADQSVDVTQAPTDLEHVMDKWLLSKTQHLIQNITQYMDNYELVKASRTLMEFVDELSTWYLRLSRDRVRAEDNLKTSHVFGYSIYTLSQLMAPLAPYFPELIHHNLVGENTSIHHTDWPVINAKLLHPKLEFKMETVKEVVNQARFLRREEGIKLRQPLTILTVVAPGEQPKDNLLQVIAQELNVKRVDWQVGDELKVELDFNLTPELKTEGEARELMRDIQKLRKKAGLQLDQHVNVEAPNFPESWQKEIERKTNTTLGKGEQLRIISS